MNSPRFTLFLIVAFVLLQTVTCTIVCYHCSSKRSGECGERFNTTINPTRSCTDPYAVCQTRYSKKPEVDLVVRGCISSYSGICEYPEFYPCYTCGESFCNLSPRVGPTFTNILSVFSLIVVKHFCII